MTGRDSHDVAMPLPTNTDGTRNAFDLYQTAFIQLSNLAGEAMEKVHTHVNLLVNFPHMDCSVSAFMTPAAPVYTS